MAVNSTTPQYQNLALATVGCGYFSQFHHEAWQRLGLTHVGVCDSNIERAKEFSVRYGAGAAFGDLQTMLEQCQPDLLDIILPPDQHLQGIRMGLEAGCHVICQKPFTLDPDQAQQAVALSEAQQRLLVVHENFRFQPWYRKLKTLIDSTDAGELYQIAFNLRPGDGQGPDAYLQRQPYFQTMKQFLIKETGVHFVDVFRFLLGEPLSVYADLRQLNPAISGEDAGHFLLEFDHGKRALFDGNRLVDHAAENHRLTMGEMQIDMEHMMFRLDGDGRIWQRRHDATQSMQVPLTFRSENFGGDCVYALQKQVVEAILTNQKPENTAADYLKNLAVQQAIYRSSEQGCKISLQ